MIPEIILSVLLAGTPYVSAKGGVAILEQHSLHFEEHNYKTGYGLAGSAGYDFGFFRLEAEALHTSNKQDRIDDQDGTASRIGTDTITRTFFFINGLFDIPVYEKLEAYAGAGYGFPRYQLMGGLRYGLTDNWGVDLGYRFVHEPYDEREYTGPECAGFKGGICSGLEEVYENHLIMIGLSYNF